MTQFTITLYVGQVDGAWHLGDMEDGRFSPSLDTISLSSYRESAEDELSMTIRLCEGLGPKGLEIGLTYGGGRETRIGLSEVTPVTCPFIEPVVLALYLSSEQVDGVEIVLASDDSNQSASGGLPLIQRLTPVNQDNASTTGGGLDPGLLRARSYPALRDAFLDSAEKLAAARIELSPESLMTLKALATRGNQHARKLAKQANLDLELATELTTDVAPMRRPQKGR